MTDASQTPTRLMRHPSFSNGRIAFSRRGAIWVAREDGSQVQRLTSADAWDDYPRFSPDGKWVAFSSNRGGSFDVFVVAAEGGEQRQLTFHSADDLVVDWTPDGKRVMFQSARGVEYPHRWGNLTSLFEVPFEGGLEQPAPTDRFYWGSYSPNGRKLAFNRNGNLVQWWRQHYRGPGAADLWVMDTATREFTRLTVKGYAGAYLWPMYGRSGEIYFVADPLPGEANVKPGSRELARSESNIWKIPERGGEATQLTHHRGGVFFPSISADRRTIVYEAEFGLWKLDLDTGVSTEIRLTLPPESREADVETLVLREADSFDLSPSGNRAVASSRGQVFTIPTHEGRAELIRRSGSRDTDPRWSPDAPWIAFLSDRSGEQEIWVARPDGGGLRKLTDSGAEKAGLCWSPDSKSLAYSTSDRKLCRVSIGDGTTQVIAASETSEISDPEFSPDGEWVSYTRTGTDGRRHIYVIAASGGAEHRISCEGFVVESRARWTPDGTRLVFLAGQSVGGLRASESNGMQICIAALERGGHSPSSAEGGPPGSQEHTRTSPRTRIEWQGMERRVHPLSNAPSGVREVVPSSDGQTYALVAGSGLYMIRDDGKQPVELAESDSISSSRFSPDGRIIYYRDNGGIWASDMGSPPARRRLDFSVPVAVDHRAERRQVFNETWRLFRDRFYHPDMHGVDWDRVKTVYGSLVDSADTAQEFQDLMLQMIGELNVSHARYSGPRPRGGSGVEERVETRYPGFELAPDPSGCYRVSRIYRGGPADRDDLRIAVGDFVLALNGQAMRAGDNYWRLYGAAPGAQFEFTVNSQPSPQGAWVVKVEPVDGKAYAALQRRAWVAEKRALVDRLSGGEIAYHHIAEMDPGDLDTFERELTENRDRKALIIDVRFNPGGGISQQLLADLQQRQYQAVRSPRTPGVEINRPRTGFFGPVVLLQNEACTSDTELFSDGFRTLGLGKVVGVPSFGAACASSVFDLVDGSTAIVPTAAFLTVRGEDLENHAVPVDVYVENTPADWLAGRDPQLEKCVALLKAALAAGRSR